MRHLLEHVRATTPQPGDVFISNDPYGSGGQHLPDIYVIKPIFLDGGSRATPRRWPTTPTSAASRPAAIAVHATEIYQEGLRHAALKLYEAGVPNATLLAILEKNTRQPVQVLGDLRAQLAACAPASAG